jgi:integrase
MPRRAKNSELRTREYLTEHEVETLMAAARKNRHGHHDATMILIAFRHGLRASELVDLRWIRSISIERRHRIGCVPRLRRRKCGHEGMNARVIRHA